MRMRKNHVAGPFSCYNMADSSTVCALLPLEKGKSAVWEYFGFPSRDGEFIEKENHRLLQTMFEGASVPRYYNEHDGSLGVPPSVGVRESEGDR